MATPQQQQTIIHQLAAQSPEFAAAPPDLQAKWVAAMTSGSPKTQMTQLAALQKEYPEYITNESIWKNPGFIAGLGALTIGVGSAAIPALIGSSAGGGGAFVGPTLEQAGGSALAGGASAVTGAAGTGFGAALKAALPTIIGAGAQVGGAAIAAHGNTKAAEIAAAQQDRALAQAKEIYQQQRADLSPYRSMGVNALGPLSFGMGLPTPDTTKGPFDQPQAPPPYTVPGAVDASGHPMAGRGNEAVTPPTTAQQMGTLNQMNSSTVRVQNPQTGLVHLIPADQVSVAVQNGGRIV